MGLVVKTFWGRIMNDLELLILSYKALSLSLRLVEKDKTSVECSYGSNYNEQRFKDTTNKLKEHKKILELLYDRLKLEQTSQPHLFEQIKTKIP